MTSFATLDGHRVTVARVHIPQHGAFWGTVDVDVDAVIAGQVTLKIGGLELVGTVERGRAYAGAAKYRIVGGATGWRASVIARSYQGAALKLSTVLVDAARDGGEVIADGYTDRTIGTAYVREAGPAHKTLDELAGIDGWHIGNDGQTVIGARPTGAVSEPYQILNYAPASQVAVIATEAPEDFAPGKTIQLEGSTLTIAALTLHLSDRGLRVHAECTSVASESRLELAVRAAIEKQLPRQLAFLGVHEYRVIAQSGQLLDVAPRHPAKGLPALAKVPQYPGLHGTETDAKVGATVLVTFLNGDPTRPIVCGYERPEASGATADQIRLGGGTLEVARNTDPIEAGWIRFNPATPLLEWSADNIIWVPVTVAMQLVGTITDGRDEVRA